MNFEDAFKHYREHTATEEEREYVENEIAKAKALSNFLEDEGINVSPAPIAEADKISIRMAKNKFKIRYLIYALSSVCIVLVVIASILGGVFGSASVYANKKIVYNEIQCKEIAFNYTLDYIKNNSNPLVNSSDIIIEDVDKNFEYESPIQDSYYGFVITVKEITSDVHYYVYVNSCTGEKFIQRIKR